MQANTRTPFELFGNQVQYVVPLFQRPYVWNLEDQWAPLWEDVRNVAEQLLDSAAPQEVPPHFLGAVVLDQQRGPSGYITQRHIIDGQQRLTTLQVLLDAVELVTKEYGESRDASALSGLVLNNTAIAQNAHDVFKVWPTNYDRAAFQAAMDDGLEAARELESKPIVQAHSFFREVAAEWADVEGDPEKTQMRLSALARTLIQYLKLVVIDLDEGDNAQVIFETLNHRGAPLLAADLVKNRVFQLAEADGVSVERLYHDVWEPFDSEHWRTEIRRGRLRRPRIDVFLYYWLAMKKRRVVAEDRLFTEFDSLVRQASDVVRLVEEFAQDAEVYEQLDSFAPYSVEGTFAYRVLDVLDAQVWTPVVLWLYRWPDGSLPDGQRELALRALESWLLRRAICRLTTQQMNRMMGELLVRLEESGPAIAGDVTLEFLASGTGESEYWPSDNEVCSAIKREPIYKRLKRARVRMLLEALEDSYRSDKTEDRYCERGKLTIEHVLPVGWREHWSLPDAAEPDELLKAKRDELIHTLGNLTLVTDRLNPALSNRPWRDESAVARGLGDEGKRAILDDHTVLFLNRRLVRDHTETWSEDDIADRSAELCARLIRLWPNQDEMR